MHTSRHWREEPDYHSLLWAQPTARSTKLEFTRAGLNGRIIGYNETIVSAAGPSASASLLVGAASTAKNSTSMQRAPGAKANFVRGKSGNFIFAPGGLEDEVLKDDDELEADIIEAARINGHLDGEEGEGQDAVAQTVQSMEALLETRGKGLRTVPPGFSRGFFEKAEAEEDLIESQEDFAKGLMPEPVYVPIESLHVSALSGKEAVNGHAAQASGRKHDTGRLDAELDELLPTEVGVT
jgi:antiviral helicase SKI2